MVFVLVLSLVFRLSDYRLRRTSSHLELPSRETETGDCWCCWARGIQKHCLVWDSVESRSPRLVKRGWDSGLAPRENPLFGPRSKVVAQCSGPGPGDAFAAYPSFWDSPRRLFHRLREKIAPDG